HFSRSVESAGGYVYSRPRFSGNQRPSMRTLSSSRGGSARTGADSSIRAGRARRFVSRYRPLLRHPRDVRGRLAVLAALTVLPAAPPAPQPLPLKVLVDNGLASHPAPHAVNSALSALGSDASPRSLILAAALTTGVLAVAYATLSGAAAWLVEATGLRMTRGVAVDLFERVPRLSGSCHSTHPAGP